MTKKLMLFLFLTPAIYFVSSCGNSTQANKPSGSQESKANDAKANYLANQPRGKVVSVEISPIALQMDNTDQTKIQAIIHLTDGSTEKNSVIWKSNDIDIVTIDTTGNIISLKPGNTTIEAISRDEPDKRAVMDITVNERRAGISPLLLGLPTPKPGTSMISTNQETIASSESKSSTVNSSGQGNVLLGVPVRNGTNTSASATPVPKK